MLMLCLFHLEFFNIYESLSANPWSVHWYVCRKDKTAELKFSQNQLAVRALKFDFSETATKVWNVFGFSPEQPAIMCYLYSRKYCKLTKTNKDKDALQQQDFIDAPVMFVIDFYNWLAGAAIPKWQRGHVPQQGASDC